MNNENTPSLQPLSPNISFEEAARQARANPSTEVVHVGPQEVRLYRELLKESEAPSPHTPAETGVALVGEVHHPREFREGVTSLIKAMRSGEVSTEFAHKTLATVAGHEQFNTPLMQRARQEVLGHGDPAQQARHLQQMEALHGSIGYASPLEEVATTYEAAVRDVKDLHNTRVVAEEARVTARETRRAKLERLNAIDPAFLTPQEQAEITPAVLTTPIAPRVPHDPSKIDRRMPYAMQPHHLAAAVDAAPRDQQEAFHRGMAAAEDETHTFAAIGSRTVIPGKTERVPGDVKVAGGAKMPTDEEMAKSLIAFDAAHDRQAGREKLLDQHRQLELEGVPVEEIQARLGKLASLYVRGQLKLMDMREKVALKGYNEETREFVERKWPRRVLTAVGGLAVAGVIGYLGYKAFVPPDAHDIIASNPLPTPTGKGAENFITEVPVEPKNPEKKIHYISKAARHIAPGEMIEKTLDQLDIPKSKWDDVLESNKAAKVLVQQGDAYKLADGSYGLRLGDGRLSNKSIQALYDAAGMDEAVNAKFTDKPTGSTLDSIAQRRELLHDAGLTGRGEALLDNFIDDGSGTVIRVHSGDGFAQIAQRYGLNRAQLRELMQIAADQPGVTYREAGEIRLNPATIRLTPEQITRILRKG